MWGKLVLSALSIFVLIGCTIQQDQVDESNAGPTANGPPEPTYCPNPSSPTAFSPSWAISGIAQFNRRNNYGTSMVAMPSYHYSSGLGSSDPTYNATTNPHNASVLPIRYAEVRVYNSAGTMVTCTETDGSGNFAFTLPRDNATYTVGVFSRSANSHLYASVMNRPTLNQLYAVTTTVVASANDSSLDLRALASGTTLAGAFNILDQLLNANLYLVNEVGSCSFTGCTNYDPSLKKVSAYWELGFNPNDYFGGGSGLSFYLPGYSRLFILGGVDGDSDAEDTDHFDNSVILHEYGHFLEDNWFATDSPGGSHDGDSIITPTLAWSEGWGDFFQAAVRTWVNDANDLHPEHYIDTVGNWGSAGSKTGLYFYVSTETCSGCGFDYTTVLGEGNFREFSVTRMLYDIVDSAADTAFTVTDNVSGGFSEIWAALTKSSKGFKDSKFAFRNAGLMLLAQQWIDTNNGGTDWSDQRTMNRLTASTDHFAQYVIPSTLSSGGGGSCLGTPSYKSSTYFFQITPDGSATNNWGGADNGFYSESNMFSNNRFYHLRIGNGSTVSPGVHQIKLTYDVDTVGSLANLDLYIYNESARFGDLDTVVSYSIHAVSGTSAQSEQVTVNLPAGDYLINVNVNTAGTIGATTDYNVLLDGAILCPADLLQ